MPSVIRFPEECERLAFELGLAHPPAELCDDGHRVRYLLEGYVFQQATVAWLAATRDVPRQRIDVHWPDARSIVSGEELGGHAAEDGVGSRRSDAGQAERLGNQFG